MTFDNTALHWRIILTKVSVLGTTMQHTGPTSMYSKYFQMIFLRSVLTILVIEETVFCKDPLTLFAIGLHSVNNDSKQVQIKEPYLSNGHFKGIITERPLCCRKSVKTHLLKNMILSRTLGTSEFCFCILICCIST